MDQSVYLEKNISQQPALDLLQSMGIPIFRRRTANHSAAAGTMCC